MDSGCLIKHVIILTLKEKMHRLLHLHKFFFEEIKITIAWTSLLVRHVIDVYKEKVFFLLTLKYYTKIQKDESLPDV